MRNSQSNDWIQNGALRDYVPCDADQGLRTAIMCDNASLAVIAESPYGALETMHSVNGARSIPTARRLCRAMIDQYGAEYVYLALYMSGSFICTLTAQSIL